MGSDTWECQGRHPAEEIERLLAEIEDLPDARGRALAEELVRSLLSLYGEGLRRMVELLSAAESSQRSSSGTHLLELLASDELVAALLLLHDLHPVPLRVRLEQALEELRPVVQGHGGELVLVDLAEGVLSLRLTGSCHGCPASLQYLRQRIEEAVYRVAPDLSGLEIEEGTEAAGGTVGQRPPQGGRPVPMVFVPRRRAGSPAPVTVQGTGGGARGGEG
ncbi:NifU family protein [Thermogemmatispora sp.]|jgi:Fe-S cluster biogenesis protein NfuA|uniref:NifU family protein n=1 Tax=Thermogemmatispora sp. TaxID=1968838 RepID=UPI0035E45634